MELQRTVTEDFLTLFYNEIECDIEDTNSKLNLNILRIENNKFAYEDLIKKLHNAVIPFALSRQEIDKLINEQRYGELHVNAIEKFRNYKTNNGETGELLLFCFLEAHLKAPKLLTKLEIKQNSDDYAKGSDGIHLLKLNDNKYHLVFGESKLYANLTDSITQAFKSIHDFTTRTKSNIHNEIGLLNTQLCKEAIDDETYKLIKSIIFPTTNSKDAPTKDNAFGIFAGFELNISQDDIKLPNDDFRKKIIEQTKKEVELKKAHIKNKIEEHQLFGYTFYIYAFPFIDLDNKRKEIIQKITTN